VDTFAEMLDAAASRSPSFRSLMGQIVSDTAHPVRVIAQKNAYQTFGDSFKTKVVDLSDIEMFPVTVPRGAHDVTQGELVVHFMAERYAAATRGVPNATELEDRFHLEGLVAQSKFRQEAFGQVGVTKQGQTGDQNGVGRFTFFFADGWYQDVYMNLNLDILLIKAPTF
jgi:hypothetical protein